MNIPKLYELLLFIIHENGDRFRGKTNIHKNIYLLQQMSRNVELPARFRPYFYGPYSQDVSDSLDLLETVGLLQVREIDFGSRGSLDYRQFVYELTSNGKKAAENVLKSYPDFVELFQKRFETLRLTGNHENTKVLSTAAKVMYILTTERKGLNSDSIRALAKELGWQIASNDLDASIQVLTKTRLAKKT